VQCVGGDALRTQYQDQADMKASKGTQCQEQTGVEHFKILNLRTSQACSKVDRMERSHFLGRYIS
jgi:phosphoribosyl-dephospho-CoA transferase